VRVVRALELIGREQRARVDDLSDGVGADRARHALQHVTEARFEVQAVVEDDVGVPKAAHVALARHVQVRIDPRAHQRGDLDALAADVADGIGDHPDGGDGPNRARVAFVRRLRSATG